MVYYFCECDVMNTGNKGRFSDRIKKIIYRKRNAKVDDSSNITGVVKRILLFPLMLLDKKIHEDKVSNYKDTNSKSSVSFKKDNTLYNKDIREEKTKRHRYNIRNITKNVSRNNVATKQHDDISETKMSIRNNSSRETIKKDNSSRLARFYRRKNNSDIENRNRILSGLSVIGKKKSNEEQNVIGKNDVNVVSKQKDFDSLSGKIMTEISKYLIKNINTLETIESDLFVLSKFDGNQESLDKCREYIVKLRALQNKINKIRKDFNILKENIDFDDILEISDNLLLDKLIEFRNSVDKDENLRTIENYKLLDEYKYLYDKIDKVVKDTDKLEIEIINRKDELEQAGINFDDFQKKVYSFDKLEDTTCKMLEKQDKILSNLSSKVSDISVTKTVERIYKGFGSLIFNSLKLYGLYMLSPFKNSVPGIAMATVATKKTVDNLLKTVHVDEKTKYIYHINDYRLTLNSSMNDLSELDRLLSSSLSDVHAVRSEFINKFSSYANQLPKYNNVLKRINQIEKQIINNQVKIRVLSQRLLKKKRENEEAMIKVKKLNNE